MHSSTSPSSIFKGCTVRVACFCKQSFLIFTENSLRKRFSTCSTNTTAKTTERDPRGCQKRPQNPPLDARPRGVKTHQNHAPDPTWNHKITQTLPRSEQKPLLGGRGHHRARQMDPKGILQTGPRATKSRIYVRCQKNMICGISLEATETLLGG